MILLDTNFIVYYLHKVEPYATKIKGILLREADLAISLRVLDEILFTSIRMEAWRKLDIRKLNELREHIRKQGLSRFNKTIRSVVEFIRSLDIAVLEDRGSIDEIVEIIQKYSLLLGDALIAVTCKHHGITTIATFDEDFKRIEWLEVIP